MALPSYESVYLEGGDIGALIGAYLDLPSLQNLILVNSQAYKAFNSLLWNDPMKWIGRTQRPFSNIVRFMEIARRSRKTTRDLVISIDLRALQDLSNSSRYRQDFHRFETIISYDWIARYQTMFANLRFVMLDDLRVGEEASFDSENSNTAQPKESFEPLLLSYRGLHIDASQISEESVIEKVMYLDISGTFRPDQWTRAMQEANFRNIRIIKLCGMRLTDRMFPYNLLVHNSLKVWSLDLRDNILGDDFIAVILRQTGIAAYDASLHPTDNPIFHIDDENLYDGAPFYTRDDENSLRSPYNTLVPVREDGLEAFTKYLRSNGNMTTDPRHALPTDDIYVRHTGLTHLYVSQNKLTSNAIHELFKFENNRLQVLDIGSLQVPHKDSATMNYSALRFQNCVSFAVVDCAKYFKRETGNRIEKLNIHHSFVTLVPTVVQSILKQGYRLDHLKQAENISESNPELWGEAFRPQDNYRLRELTLTDIPTKSFGTIIKRLITFLKLCYDQQVMLEQAHNRPTQQHYRAPPLLSGLCVLKLEFLHPGLEPIDTNVTSVSNPNSISDLGDRDADAFLSSSAGDFSFFSTKPERPDAVQTRSVPLVPRGQATGVPSVKGQPYNDSEQSKRSQRTGNLNQDIKESAKQSWKGKGNENGRENTRSDRHIQRRPEAKGEPEMWPKDVIEELKRFRSTRPRWSGNLMIVRPIYSEEREGEGLMGWE